MTSLPTIAAALIIALPLHAVYGQNRSEIAIPPNGGNQQAEVSQWIGLVKVTVTYHSPKVHSAAGVDRTGHIWGELVQFGFFDDGFGPSHATPWRAGANESTTISFSHDVVVEGTPIKAGTYALFLELEPTGPWTWILSTNSSGWGSFQYDVKNDALRAAVTTQEAPYTEYLMYGFDDRRLNGAVLFLQWERKRVPLRIDVPNTKELYVAQIRKDLLSWPGFNYQNWQNAAQMCVALNINLEEALVWAEKAISEPFRNAGAGRADFSTYQTKALVLNALGRIADADTVMDVAVRFPGTDAPSIYVYGMRMLRNSRNARAMEIFRLNRQRHPDDKFVTAIGLARGYAATGDKKSAIGEYELALRNVPPVVPPILPGGTAQVEKELRALKDVK